ncbi:hypothetical protein [Bacillus sp. JCM 19041]
MASNVKKKKRHNVVDWFYTIGELALYAVMYIPRLIRSIFTS